MDLAGMIEIPLQLGDTDLREVVAAGGPIRQQIIRVFVTTTAPSSVRRMSRRVKSAPLATSKGSARRRDLKDGLRPRRRRTWLRIRVRVSPVRRRCSRQGPAMKSLEGRADAVIALAALAELARDYRRE